jgi:hypothetical protein
VKEEHRLRACEKRSSKLRPAGCRKVPSEELGLFHCIAAIMYSTTHGMLWRKCLLCVCVGAWRDRVKWENVINTAMKFWILYGIVKRVHRKLLSSTEENVRTLTVCRVPYYLANLAGEIYVLAETGVSVNASFTLH